MTETIDPRAHNALKEGLFTRRDFGRPGELSEYDQFRQDLLACLTPKSALEQNYADEIVSSQWRLRRCRLTEAVLATRCDDEFFLSPDDEARQKSVDRARAQAQNALRKATAELRKIQTERECRIAYSFGKDWGLAESRTAFAAFKAWRKEVKTSRDEDFKEFKEMLEQELGPLPPAEDDEDEAATSSESSSVPDLICKAGPPASPLGVPARPAEDDLICKNTPIRVEKTGRNEPCPCGSGLKYKKCCINGPKTQTKLAA